MKKVFLVCAAMAGMTHLYAQKAGVTITGKIPSVFNNEYIYLLKGRGTALDSAKVEKGAFTLKYALTDTIQAALRVTKKEDGKSYYGTRNVFLKPGDKVSLTVKDTSGGNLLAKGVLKGASLSLQQEQLQKELKEVTGEMDALRSRYMQQMQAVQSGKAQRDTAAEMAMGNKMSELWKQQEGITNAFINAHPDYYVSLVEFKESLGGRVKDVPATQERFNKFTPALRQSSLGLSVQELLKASAKLSVNQPAPDFASTTPDGKTLKLSDLKGKYVLLDFWASWCGPCRAENPNVVKAFQQYKDKNFTVLGVSLDREGAHDKWTEAIEKDGLAWYHVSDLKWWKADAAALYMIRSIPQNFLIDPNGKIIASNLRGEALQEELARLLK
ncbi:redoxin domain-containing protein [Chitinophaga oryzae]|uniref:Redoxin domain-containing protein n=1 Tax=Chitinophaga oryzae TaxID=2725414 RepID=A0AAE7D7U9_9BACT|nr:TlpA disulfide reductase family protein [Chitinophaga oryzae]QJB33195.1 redoxin domain-containing protein [Chitinophaga oryzae]QJB39671.1 redoxin domain-containing protein [Chitinophaga oryzae]